MATWIDVEFPSAPCVRAELVFRTFEQVEALASEWRASSPLAAVNEGAGRGPAVVPTELLALLERGVALGKLTGGAFDVSWAALWGLWDFKRGVIPPAQKLATALSKVDYRRVKLDPANRLVAIAAGMKLGLGGIAKGWALARAGAMLRNKGVTSFSLSAGGQVLVAGGKQGRPWRVGLRDPRAGAETFFAIISLRDGSVATSGDYERYFERAGRRYHHILDPRTGQPTRGLRSATVVDADATRADALATALMVLGRERGLALIERLPGVEAVVVDATGQVHRTRGLGADRFKLLRAPRR